VTAHARLGSVPRVAAATSNLAAARGTDPRRAWAVTRGALESDLPDAWKTMCERGVASV
jgi:hypothetical protein